MKRYRLLTVLAVAALLFYACSKSSSGGDDTSTTDTFKKSMLLNYADTLILPAYTALQTKLDALDQSAKIFLATPSSTNQAALKTPFKEAYVAFEGVSAVYFGVAAAVQLNSSLNSFPTNVSKIESGIQSGNYDLSQIIVSDSIQGFPALDYLLFSSDAVQQFNGASANNRKKYITDVIARMKTLAGNTVSQWNGTYRTTFINSLQTNIGSSIGNLVNQFAFEMDALKGPRIGWPFGKQSNGIVFASKCEGYYSGISKDLAVANLTSLKKYFIGGAGNGVADYLVVLGKQQLSNDVVGQFDVALAALGAIPDPLSAAFTGSPGVIETAYREVQKLLTLIKTDVASATAVQISYMDNDGD